MTNRHSTSKVRTVSQALGSPPSTRVSLGWLVLAALTGTGLIGIHLVWERTSQHPLSGVFLEAGAGLVLFVVLLLFQRSLVERTVDATVRRLSPAELEERHRDVHRNPLTPGDFHAETGPLAVASAFVRDCADGRFSEAFFLGDPTWRLCRAQAWIYNNLSELDLAGSPESTRDEIARGLASGPQVNVEMWDEFVTSESEVFRDALRGYDDDRWGWSQRRRVVGPWHEIVIATPLPRDAPYGFLATGETLLDEHIRLLISCHRLERGLIYLVAGLNVDAAPIPGWPPTWWIVDDLAAQCHPGLGVLADES